MGRKRAEQRIVSVSEIPPEVIGAVIAADLAQIEADAGTHPDQDASRRILFAADRLRQLARAELTPALAEKLRKITDVLNE